MPKIKFNLVDKEKYIDTLLAMYGDSPMEQSQGGDNNAQERDSKQGTHQDNPYRAARMYCPLPICPDSATTERVPDSSRE